MASIVRWGNDSVENAIDNLFKGFMIQPFSSENPIPRIKLDVCEDAKAFTVHAEIPGAKKEDIQVNIDGNKVEVSAEIRKSGEEKEGRTVLRAERYYGQVYRAFSLSQEIDEAAASAKYNDGVLELVLPKKSPPASKRLNVE